MAATVQQILAVVEEQAPPSLALAWDRIGLQIGSRNREVHTLAVALEPSVNVVSGALTAGAQMLLTHHPLLFQPLDRLDPDTPLGKVVRLAVQHDLAVAAAHTNLDVAPHGVNDYLAQVLELENIRVLEETGRDGWLKLAVFVPLGYEDRVRQALCDDRVGVIGPYSQCSFSMRGEGTFLPEAGAHPFQGQTGHLNRVPESRLEVLLPASRMSHVISRLRAAHPYEEPAFDLYPLSTPGLSQGLGRIGEWDPPRRFSEVLPRLKEIFHTPTIKLAGQPPAAIGTVALCGGSGGELLSLAAARGVDLFLSGDLRYHQVAPWSSAPLAICDLGHYATEALFIPVWVQDLKVRLAAAGLEVTVILDRWGGDPFTYV